MVGEEVDEGTCKNCGAKIPQEDEIFDGFCEKCWNKWIKKREKKPKSPRKKDNMPIMTVYSCLCGVISATILIILLVIELIFLIPYLLLMCLDIITFFGASGQIEEAMKGIPSITDFVFFPILRIGRAVLAIIGYILGVISLGKYKKKVGAIIGITLAVINLIICFWGI